VRRLLLDRGTDSLRSDDLVPAQGQYVVKAWLTAGEATIIFQPAGLTRRGGSSEEGLRTDPSELVSRSVRRSAHNLKRYAAHNKLVEMMTLTYEAEPSLDEVSPHLEHFWRRWCRATGRQIPPYVIVPEWGPTKGRLHLHAGINWWAELGAVEVCDCCARPALRSKRTIPPAGCLCVGCLWGHGFVGAPERYDAEPWQLAAYLTKYLAKDMDRQPFGRQRYRVAKGFQPRPTVLRYRSADGARRGMLMAFGGELPSYTWSSENAQYRDGEPVPKPDYFCERYSWAG